MKRSSPSIRLAASALMTAIGLAAGAILFDLYVYIDQNVLNAELAGFERSVFDRQLAIAQAEPSPPEDPGSVRSVFPKLFLPEGGLDVGGETVFPLGGIPDRLTWLCRECGPMVNFQADRHGFNNPPDAWDGRPDIAVVGDSFTVGACTWTEESIAGLLRSGGRKVLNLGMIGNGPLTELAAIREYLPERRPPVVLWMFFNNDIQDLEEEAANPVLARYLDDPAFVQGLEGRSAAVGAAMAAWYDRRLAAAGAAGKAASAPMMAPPPPPSLSVVDVLLLRHARHRFGLSRGGRGGGTAHATFARALRAARDTVAGWGGELVFVYLPQAGTAMGVGDHLATRDRNVAVARDLGLRVIDATDAFAGHDPAGLFCGHYTPKGNGLVARSILDALTR